MVMFAVGSATHVGRVRRVNEDSVVVGPHLVAVADGMGGHAAGDVASSVAVSYLQPLADGDGAVRPDQILGALDEANRDIVEAAAEDPARSGMGTTVTGLAVAVVGGLEHWLVFNVGDSRVYRVGPDGLEQVSVDHSEVQELLDSGQLTPDEAATYPRRNVVTRSLGSEPAPVADVWVFPPVEGDRFLICSDGLPLELPEDLMLQLIAAEPDAQSAAESLVTAAVEAGGRDNVTALVVDLVVDEDRTVVPVDTAPRRGLTETER